jgi:hypothetical protein
MKAKKKINKYLVNQIVNNITTGYAVMFTKTLIDKMVAEDNKKLFFPLCIFARRKEAVAWRNEKYLGEKNNKSLIGVKKVLIIYD